jgi:hypothetical protein
MTYLGESGENSGLLRTSAASLAMGPGAATQATFVAPGSVTGGQFGLFRWDMPAATNPGRRPRC